MSNIETREVDPTKPHFKIWATDGDVYEDPEYGSYAVKLVVTGPETHDETYKIVCLFEDQEEALKTKLEVDNSFEPIMKAYGVSEDE